MTSYHPRSINFLKVSEIGNWKIKTYHILKEGKLITDTFQSAVTEQLPSWLEQKNGFNDDHQDHGFLIHHAGTEGIFTLVNWWIDHYMMNTRIFLTKYDNLTNFELISGQGLAPCIWELEVINHERVSWTNHILKPEKLDHDGYLNDTFSGTF